MKKQIKILPVLCLFLLTACDGNLRDRWDTSTAQDSSLSEAIFADIYGQVLNSATLGGDNFKSSSSCPTVTISPFDGTFPITIEVDFGNVNCPGADGRQRRGKLIADMSGPYTEPGTFISIVPENYYVNDMLVEGLQEVENLGLNAAGNLHFAITETNGIIHSPDGQIFWNSNRIREWVEGSDTATPWDDVYNITGTAEGTDANGRDYDLEIIAPLNVKVGCRWVRQGILEIRPDGLDERTIDYGNGDCNGNATLTIRDRDFNIVVP
ncbi:MAG: hypothetical protein EA412_14340 [Chitinophagaceae bacterium]|nr:MAG: hypothetical protein EA412_14340 [Chitinophagaceae bacterium]